MAQFVCCRLILFVFLCFWKRPFATDVRQVCADGRVWLLWQPIGSLAASLRPPVVRPDDFVPGSCWPVSWKRDGSQTTPTFATSRPPLFSQVSSSRSRRERDRNTSGGAQRAQRADESCSESIIQWQWKLHFVVLFLLTWPSDLV